MKLSFRFVYQLLALVSAAAVAEAQTAAPRSRVTDVTFPAEPPMMGASSTPPIVGASVARLPVLVPQTFLRDRSLNFVADELYYTASVRTAGASLSVTGTRVATDAGEDGAAAGVTATVSETSAEASVVRFGAAYAVTVECDKAADQRCTSDAFARTLLDSLTYVGGSPGGSALTIRQPQAPPPMTGASAEPNFRFEPPGELVSGSGQGVKRDTVYAPGLRFPVESAPAYLNSQVYGIGGAQGPAGAGWRDPRNYRYPWRDNFCESRSRRTATCPTSTGHQGVDIRPADGRDAKHWAVAVEAGRIHKIATYSVVLIGDSGSQFTYLHLDRGRLAVKPGQRVTRGQRIGLVSDDFGGERTTVHLHFEIRQNLNGRGLVPVPPYMSLVRAYQAM